MQETLDVQLTPLGVNKDIDGDEPNFPEYLENSQPATLLSVMCRHPRVRWFAYFCGAATPELSRSMTWYQATAFIWSWALRIGYLVSAGWFISYLEKEKWNGKLKDVLFNTFSDIYFTVIFTQVPVLFDICIRKKTYLRFRNDSENNFLDIKSLLKEVLGLGLLYLIVACLYVAKINCPECDIRHEVLIVLIPLFFTEAFLYFSMSYELMYIENVLDRELIAPAKKAQLTTSKFNALRAFLDKKMATHMLAFSCFTVILALSCMNLVGVMYYFTMKPMPMFQRVLNMYLFEGKDILYLFLLVWKIASLNEKSRDLTLRIADNKPTEDNTYIYMQQNSKPIVYKIFGLVSVFRTEMVLSCIGYSISFGVSLAKGLEKFKT